jgi:phosphoribosylanthranilate isomerase
MKIKLCGMMKPQDIIWANELMPDFVGFVFAASRRQLSREEAAEFRQKLNKSIPTVGVYVNEAADAVVSDFKNGIINIAQLHGNENLDYIEKLKHAVPELKIIKAIRVNTSEDVENSLDLPVDWLLFDTYKKGVAGGTGESFNWDMVKNVKRPFFLAGGLTADNLSQAMEIRPFAFDLSSGIETDGLKDFEKMKRVVELVRSAKN